MTKVKLEIIVDLGEEVGLSEYGYPDMSKTQEKYFNEKVFHLPYPIEKLELRHIYTEPEFKQFSKEEYEQLKENDKRHYLCELAASMLSKVEDIDRTVYKVNVQDITSGIAVYLSDKLFDLDNERFHKIINFVEEEAFQSNSGWEDIQWALEECEMVRESMKKQDSPAFNELSESNHFHLVSDKGVFKRGLVHYFDENGDLHQCFAVSNGNTYAYWFGEMLMEVSGVNAVFISLTEEELNNYYVTDNNAEEIYFFLELNFENCLNQSSIPLLAKMKREFLSQLQLQLYNGEDELLKTLSCLGPVYDLHPKYDNEELYFQRAWIFEGKILLQSNDSIKEELIRVVLHDEGNHYFSFICEGTEKDMDETLEIWKKQQSLIEKGHIPF